MGFITKEQILQVGFKNVGKGVLISEKASVYKPDMISVGDNTRIDDFVVLSAGDGGIRIGKNVHIAVYSSLIGKGKITVQDFANISSRVSIYSNNDDYSGNFMTNPTVDKRFSNVEARDVYIGKHVIIGSGSIVLPGVTLENGVVIGALSLVKAGIYEKFGIYGGIPVRFLKRRSQRLLKIENEYKKFITAFEKTPPFRVEMN